MRNAIGKRLQPPCAWHNAGGAVSTSYILLGVLHPNDLVCEVIGTDAEAYRHACLGCSNVGESHIVGKLRG